MTRQPINIGTEANDRTGDALRTAFLKTNNNFIELYQRVGTLEASEGDPTTDRAWTDVSLGQTYDVVEWNSGTTVGVTNTPTESYILTTYDTRIESQNIYFVWDQGFIDGVWDGYNNPLGEGMGFELSLDGGSTWYAVEQSGYNSGTYLYFSVTYANEGQYTFTYIEGQTAQIRFNRGSLPEPWFDLRKSPVDANTVVCVSMDVVVNPRMFDNSNNAFHATIFKSNVVFAPVLYNDNIGQGSINVGSTIYSGNNVVGSATNVELRMASNTEVDAGRIYCNFDDGRTGTISFYWNAKLFTRS